jgi:hypothetical protein
MKAKDIQKVKVNVGYLQVHEANRTLRIGTEVGRDEEPELFEHLTKSMANVGEEEDSTILVIEKVSKSKKKSKTKSKKGDSKKSKKKPKKSKKDKKSKKGEKTEDE